jgi:hypothetical protein
MPRSTFEAEETPGARLLTVSYLTAGLPRDRYYNETVLSSWTNTLCRKMILPVSQKGGRSMIDS